MRDTKYRAWHEKSQTWVYWTIGKTWTKLGHEVYEEICLNGSNFYEWTGLKDKKRTNEFPKGQEIYEGDILKYTYYVDTKNTRTFNELVEYELSHDKIGFQINSSMQYEVIGNIFENPELL